MGGTSSESLRSWRASLGQMATFEDSEMKRLSFVISFLLVLPVLFISLVTTGCSNTEAKQAAPQAMPVKTKIIDMAAVPRTDEYVATIKSRRSASIQPQVDGSLIKILVKSGDHVRTGQVLMTIDPLKQQATVDQQRSTEAQKKATLDYNNKEMDQQKRLNAGEVARKHDDS